MTNFKECASCPNENHWDLNDYHKSDSIGRLRICLCDECLLKFYGGHGPRGQYSRYDILANAVLKGK